MAALLTRTQHAALDSAVGLLQPQVALLGLYGNSKLKTFVLGYVYGVCRTHFHRRVTRSRSRAIELFRAACEASLGVSSASRIVDRCFALKGNSTFEAGRALGERDTLEMLRAQRHAPFRPHGRNFLGLVDHYAQSASGA